MPSPILLLALVLTTKATTIYNQDHEHQTLYSRLHSQQHQQHDPLITPLKLQYVAPKAFLTSAALVTGQQVLTTANPQLVTTGNTHPATTANPRHLSAVNRQLLPNNPESISARNAQYYQPENTHFLTTNAQLPEVNQQSEFISARNPLHYSSDSSQSFPGNQQSLPVLNQQRLTSPQAEIISQRNNQNIPPADLQILPLLNQLLANSEIISPRNSQFITTVSPQYITPTANTQLHVDNQNLFATNSQLVTARNPQYFATASPQTQYFTTGNDNTQLISGIQHENAIPNRAPVLPVIYTVQPPLENYSGHQRFNRLPPTNAILPELQFTDPKSNRLVIPNAQIAAILNALQQPSYLVMAMPPSSYTSVSYYDSHENNEQDQEINPVQSDSPQTKTNEDDEKVTTKSNVVQRSNSDDASESDSSADTPEANDDVLKYYPQLRNEIQLPEDRAL